MRIRYETTIDDHVAFNEYYQRNNPETKRVYWLVVWVMIGISLAGLVAGLSKGMKVQDLWLIPLTLLLMSRLILLPNKRRIRIAVKKYYASENLRGLIGEHELEIAEDGLIERTEYNETKNAWAMVSRIETTDTHTFIFLGKMTAHVIPHHAIIEGSLPAFLKTLGERYQPDGKLRSPAVAQAVPIANDPPDARIS